MLQVDLSTLRNPELRQLLDTARQRGQATLSYEILQEMAARRERGGQPSPEPRVVGLDLRDPLDEDAMDEATASEAAPELDDAAPLRLEREPPPPRRSRGARPPRPDKAPRPQGVWGRRVRWGMAGLVAGAAAGYIFGFWVGTDGVSSTLAPPPVAAKAAPALTVAVAQPLTPPPQPSEPVPDALTPAAEAAPTPQAPPAPAPASALTAPPVPSAPAPAETPEAPPTPPPSLAKAPAKACAGAATPADQAICGDTRLQRLQRELRAAYAEALEAHEDRDLLRERQLAWRDARDTIADPDRLARLYEERIRKLKAATAEARAVH